MKEAQLITQLVQKLPLIVPEDIQIDVKQVSSIPYKIGDIEAVLKTPKNSFKILIEVKNTDRILPLREAMRQIKTIASERQAVPFVAGIYFGDRARKVAKEEGVGLIDLAGNFLIVSRNHDTYIERIIDKNPFSQKQSSLKNLFAPVSSRITRVLLNHLQKSWILQELSQEANVSLGQTYKVIDRMIEEEIVERNVEERIMLKNAAELLEEWKKVYPSYSQQKFTFFSYEQGYMAILASILEKGSSRPFALSFFSGADLVAPFIRGITKVQMYVKQLGDIEGLKNDLNLQEVATGGNVELYVPYDEGVFYKTQTISTGAVGDVPVASNVQLYMDLFNNPARGEEQAEHLREVKLQF